MKELQDILKDKLPARQKEVITRRFGIGKTESETLAEVGERFGITRERVRQIESAAMKPLKDAIQAHPVLSRVVQRATDFLHANGGVARADNFISFCQTQNPDIGEPHLGLLAEALESFYFNSGDKEFHPFYCVSKTHEKNAQSFIDGWEKFLSNKKDSALSGKYHEHLNEYRELNGVHPAHAESFVSISKKIHRNPYGDIGLASWPEIKPQSIRDRIYLVLKKEGKPAHFRTIAERITAAGFDNRQALAATVHNELIKDPRFVLVGRGMYALKENGYESGTAREIIKKILDEQGAMHSRDVINVASKKWFFKPNTILVNLQNRTHFERLSDGKYQVKKV